MKLNQLLQNENYGMYSKKPIYFYYGLILLKSETTSEQYNDIFNFFVHNQDIVFNEHTIELFCKYCRQVLNIEYLDLNIDDNVLYFIETALQNRDIPWLIESTYIFNNHLILFDKQKEIMEHIVCFQENYHIYESKNVKNIFPDIYLKEIFMQTKDEKFINYSLLNRRKTEMHFYPIYINQKYYFYIQNNMLVRVNKKDMCEQKLHIPFKNFIVKFQEKIWVIPTDGVTIQHVDMPMYFNYELEQVEKDNLSYLKYCIVNRIISRYDFIYSKSKHKLIEFLCFLLFLEREPMSLLFLKKLKLFSKYFQTKTLKLLDRMIAEYNEEEILELLKKSKP